MKTMKTLMLASILTCGLLPKTTFAQKGAYVNLNLGYNMALSSQRLGTNYENSSIFSSFNNASSTKEEVIYGSFGRGISFGAAFGYMITDNFGLELGFSKLKGNTYNASYENKSFSSSGSSSRVSEYKVSSSMYQFKPSLVLTAGKYTGLNPYGKIGAVIGSGSITSEDETSETAPFTPQRVSTFKFKRSGGLAFGMNAAIGTHYYLGEKFSLYGELNFISMSYSPTKGEYTELTENGVDRLDERETSSKEYKYVDNIERNSSDIEDSSEPSELLKSAAQFGSIGLKVGLHYRF